MLYCCHKYFHQTEKRYLKDTFLKSNQLLEFGECPLCKSKRIWYQYTNIFENKKREITLKGKKAEQLLKDLLHQPYCEIGKLKEKVGTKNNMFWLYQVNGTIKDFNNTIKGNCKTEIVNIKADNSISAPLVGAFY